MREHKLLDAAFRVKLAERAELSRIVCGAEPTQNCTQGQNGTPASAHRWSLSQEDCKVTFEEQKLAEGVVPAENCWVRQRWLKPGDGLLPRDGDPVCEKARREGGAQSLTRELRHVNARDLYL